MARTGNSAIRFDRWSVALFYLGIFGPIALVTALQFRGTLRSQYFDPGPLGMWFCLSAECLAFAFGVLGRKTIGGKIGLLGSGVVLGFVALMAGLWWSTHHPVDTRESAKLEEHIDSKMTEEAVVAIGVAAINAKMPPEYVAGYKPYRAALRDGVWHVFGTLPGDCAGGTPEARVRDSDGKALDVFHTQ